MAVNFRSEVSSPNVNQAYISKNADDETLNKLGLKNADSESGNIIQNAQGAINKIFISTGVLSESNANSNVFANNFALVDDDSYKVSLEKLDTGLSDASTARASLLSIINTGAFRIKEFASDAEYITLQLNSAAPTGGEVYYNTTSGSVRYYNAIATEWVSLDLQAVAKQEIPTGAVNGTNAIFAVSLLPLDDNSIIVFVDGVALTASGWSRVNADITLGTPPSLGQVVYVWYLTEGLPASPILILIPEVEYREVLADDLINGEMPLTFVPYEDEKVQVDVLRSSTGAAKGACEYNVDYVVAGQAVVWDSLGLETGLIAGDKLRIAYYKV